jgi:hypothetical protein
VGTDRRLKTGGEYRSSGVVGWQRVAEAGRGRSGMASWVPGTSGGFLSAATNLWRRPPSAHSALSVLPAGLQPAFCPHHPPSAITRRSSVGGPPPLPPPVASRDYPRNSIAGLVATTPIALRLPSPPFASLRLPSPPISRPHLAPPVRIRPLATARRAAYAVPNGPITFPTPEILEPPPMPDLPTNHLPYPPIRPRLPLRRFCCGILLHGCYPLAMPAANCGMVASRATFRPEITPAIQSRGARSAARTSFEPNIPAAFCGMVAFLARQRCDSLATYCGTIGSTRRENLRHSVACLLSRQRPSAPFMALPVALPVALPFMAPSVPRPFMAGIASSSPSPRRGGGQGGEVPPLALRPPHAR